MLGGALWLIRSALTVLFVVFDVRQQNQDLTPKMLHLEDQLTTVDKKPTAYLTVGQMSIEWQKQR